MTNCNCKAYKFKGSYYPLRQNIKYKAWKLPRKMNFKGKMKVIYEGESKSKGKIHLTALTEVTVNNFTYHFSK